MFCSSSSCSQTKGSTWSSSDKILVASASILTITTVALAVIFFVAHSLTNMQNLVVFYAVASLGGIAVLGLILGGSIKLYDYLKKPERHSLAPQPPASNDEQFASEIRPQEGELANKDDGTLKTNSQALKRSSSCDFQEKQKRLDLLNLARKNSVSFPLHNAIDSIGRQTSFSNLPGDIVLRIFSFLNVDEVRQNRLVCHQWKVESNNKGLQIQIFLPYEKLQKCKSDANISRDPNFRLIQEGYCHPFKVDYYDLVELTRKCVYHNQRNELRLLAHTLFSGPWNAYPCGGLTNISSKWLLTALIYDPDSECLDIGRMLLQCFKDWRKAYTPPCYVDFSHKKYNEISNQEAFIRHVGGHDYIQSFLKGDVKGYPLDGQGVCLPIEWCNPEDPDLPAFSKFLDHEAVGFFDHPAVLEGCIQRENLTSSYSSSFMTNMGLLQENQRRMSQVKIRLLPIDYINICKEEELSWYEEVFKDVGFGKRVNQSVERHKKQKEWYYAQRRKKEEQGNSQTENTPIVDYQRLEFKNAHISSEFEKELRRLREKSKPDYKV